MEDKDFKDLDQFFRKRLTDMNPAESGWNVPPDSILKNAMDAISSDRDIDQVFRKKLTDIVPADNGWNVPPDSILENALDAINSKPTPRRPWLMRAILASGVIGLIVAVGVVAFHIDSLNDEISKLKSQQTSTTEHIIAQNNSSSVEVNTADVVNIQSENLEVNQIVEEKANKVEPTIAAPSTEEYTVVNDNAATQSSIIQSTSVNVVKKETTAAPAISSSDIDTPTHTSIISSQAPASQKNNYLGTSANNIRPIAQATPLNAIEEIALLTSSFPALNVDFDGNITQPSNHQELQIEDKKKRNLSVYVLSGLTLNKYNADDQGQTDLSGHDSFYSGSNSEIGLNIGLSKRLNLRTSVGYSKWKNESVFQSDYTYDVSKMVIDHYGVPVYTDAVTVTSPNVTTREQTEFLFESRDMEDGAQMRNITDITEDYQAVSLSLGLSYDIIQRSKFALSGYVGTTVRSLISASQEVNTRLFDGSVLMADEVNNYDIKDQLNKQAVSANLGTQLTYRLSPRFDLLLNADFGTDLTSQVNSDITSQRSSFFIGTGFGFRF